MPWWKETGSRWRTKNGRPLAGEFGIGGETGSFGGGNGNRRTHKKAPAGPWHLRFGGDGWGGCLGKKGSISVGALLGGGPSPVKNGKISGAQSGVKILTVMEGASGPREMEERNLGEKKNYSGRNKKKKNHGGALKRQKP